MRYKTELMQSILKSETAQKMIDYVSPIYGNSYVGLWIFQAMGTALDDLCKITEQLRFETNPCTADLLLDSWERQYGLPKDSSLTKEQRRLRIIQKKTKRGACNRARLEAAVSYSLGGVKVEIDENVSKNKFVVNVRDYVENLVPAVAVIERMKPAHLIYQIRIMEQFVSDADIKVAIAMTHAEQYNVEVY